MPKLIAVHNQSFHADDSLACFLLLNTKEFAGADIARTRNPEILENADCVCDVGGIYDHEKRRYDHHQPEFKLTFPDSEIPCASCGAVYIHWGKEVIDNILKENGREYGNNMEYLYTELYKRFVKEVDANDNGVSQFERGVIPQFTICTGISARIAMMNPPDLSKDNLEMFRKAIDLIGKEFTQCLLNMVDYDLKAIDIVKAAYEARFETDPSGQIMVLHESCGYDKHLRKLEEEHKDQPIVLYVVSPRTDGSYNIRAVGTGVNFDLRKPLPFAGLRDEELEKASGIPGAIFVHKAAFLGGYKQLDQAIAFAKLALSK